MKVYILFFVIVFCLSCHEKKSREFTLQSNGLIYTPAEIVNLKNIVNKENDEFKNCELNRTYYSKYQGKGHYIEFHNRMENGHFNDLIEDLNKDLGHDSLLKKYRKYIYDRKDNVYIVRQRYLNFYESLDTCLFSIDANYNFGKKVKVSPSGDDIIKTGGKNKWIYEFIGRGTFKHITVKAYFLTDSIKQQIIPEKYARSVQYVDCMIDTNSRVINPPDSRTRESSLSLLKKVQDFLVYVDYPNEPGYETKEEDLTPEEMYRKYEIRYDRWFKKKLEYIDKELSHTTEFKLFLSNAFQEALKFGNGTHEFERIVEKFTSAENALALKRRRRVVGSCSMDMSPRIHALSIARLSAKTRNWNIFLRAHLNLMNDHFARVSDASWGWSGRQTYISELEELEIDVFRLLIGSSLRVENVNQNHYQSSVGRIGRSLSEAQNRRLFENKIISMIKDEKLDNYNRYLIYLLYVNYIHSISNQAIRWFKIVSLKLGFWRYPKFLQKHILTLHP